MIRGRLACVAARIIVSESSKQLTIVDLIEQIRSPLYPLVLPSVSAVFFLQRDSVDDPNDIELRLSITVGETMILDRPVSTSFTGQLITRSIFEMAGLPIPHPGAVKFALATSAAELASWTVIADQVAEVTVPTSG